MSLEKIHHYLATCDECEKEAEYSTTCKNGIPVDWIWRSGMYFNDTEILLCDVCKFKSARELKHRDYKD